MSGLELFNNYPQTTATGSSGSTSPVSGTTESWTVTSSSSFPAVTSAHGNYFRISDPAQPTEVITVTNISGTTWSVIRGDDGTTPVAHANGFTIKQVVSAGWLNSAKLGTPLGGPAASTPTMFGQPDGSIVVLPLSYYGITGDDSVWINSAFSLFPTITGGSGSYGGSYNGPWSIGTIRLLPADYKIHTCIVAPLNGGATVNIIGHGPGTRMLVASGKVGLTSHVAMGGPQAGQPGQQNMATYRGMRFDGSAGATTGIEIGGGWGRHVDVAIVNFNAVGAVGLHLNNATNAVSAEWTEKCRFSVDLLQNATAVVIENSTSSNANASSFEYNDLDFYIIQTNSATANGPGVLLKNGAYLSGGSLRMRGNMPTNSGPALSIQGNDGAGTNSAIYHEFVDITMETAATSNFPQTINIGTNNEIVNCNGLLSFQFGTWTGATVPSGGLKFGGIIFEQGSTNLQTANATPQGWI
jgi:hypothetical protein